MKKFYCDGACKGNPGRGGWGVLLEYNSATYEAYGFHPGTTNNRMELIAAIESLKLVEPGEAATVSTDSQYVSKGITEWIVGWKKHNWRTSKKEDVKNADLWKQLDNLASERNITWEWVRGHNGHPGNERADALANIGSSGKNSPTINIGSTGTIIAKKTPKHAAGDIIMVKDKKMMVLQNNALMQDGSTQCYILMPVAIKDGDVLVVPIDADTQNSDIDTTEYKEILYSVHIHKNHAQDIFTQLEKSCKHNIKQKWSSATCDICDKYFGWYCPDSPDHACHYYSNEGKVELLDGTLMNVPEDHDPSYETDDDCMFCHQPEERK